MRAEIVEAFTDLPYCVYEWIYNGHCWSMDVIDFYLSPPIIAGGWSTIEVLPHNEWGTAPLVVGGGR